jgi:hypothetical protein
MLLLSLFACSNDYTIHEPEAPPFTLEVTSPEYGSFLGDEPAHVVGKVSPPTAWVQVNGTTVHPDDDGNFEADVPLTDRAMWVDVTALQLDEMKRVIVPVFDDADPRSADPGAIGGLLTPTGLDAMEPLIEEQIDALGWEDQLFAALPTIDTDYVDLTPVSVTSNGSDADLAPGFDAVELTLSLTDVEVLTDVTLLDTYTFELGISLGNIGIGAHASPWIDGDGMLGMTLSDAIVSIEDPGLSVEGWEIPDWVSDLLFQPVADLVSALGETLGDLLLDQVGDLEIGGPFAFDFDLMGTSLSAQLVEVDANPDGISLGATVGYGEDAATEMPDVAYLTATTPSGLDYQLGAAIHEGMFNVLLDETLAGFLDFEMELEGDYGKMLGSGIAALDGGEDMPEDTEGYCLALRVGDARVIRMVEGTGAPIARAYLPDVQFDVDTIVDGDCEDWMQAQIFGVLDLSMEGTEITADFDVADVALLEYGADSYDRNAVEDQLGGVIEGMAGLFAGQLSFDLGGAIDLGGLTVSPTVVSVEPLDDDGLYGLYLDVFPTE